MFNRWSIAVAVCAFGLIPSIGSAQGLDMSLPRTGRMVPGTMWRYNIQTNVYMRGDTLVVLYTNGVVTSGPSQLHQDPVALAVVVKQNSIMPQGCDPHYNEVLFEDQAHRFPPASTMVSHLDGAKSPITRWDRRDIDAADRSVSYLYLSPGGGGQGADFINQMRNVVPPKGAQMTFKIISPRGGGPIEVTLPTLNFKRAYDAACRVVTAAPPLPY